MVLKIVIVEDERKEAEALSSLLERYARESHRTLSIKIYSDAVTFLSEYKADADIIFMDIEMPDMDGMEAAKKLRGNARRVRRARSHPADRRRARNVHAGLAAVADSHRALPDTPSHCGIRQAVGRDPLPHRRKNPRALNKTANAFPGGY